MAIALILFVTIYFFNKISFIMDKKQCLFRFEITPSKIGFDGKILYITWDVNVSSITP